MLHLECLEPRALLSATTAYEIYAWSLINQMRENPKTFADEIDGLYRNTLSSGHGVLASDPVWTDLRQMINTSHYPQHYGEALALMRVQPPLGPLAWEYPLETISYEHNLWMTTHCYAHSYYPGGTPSECFGNLPGYSQPGINGDPDLVNPTILGTWSNGRWGENISFETGSSLPATRGAYGTGTPAHRQRQAYADTLGYLLEFNSDTLGHLKNLLSRDRTDGAGLTLSTENKTIAKLNAIGVDFLYRDGGLSTGTTNLLGTHTLSAHSLPAGGGGYFTGLVYEDFNRNRQYDAGEGVTVNWYATYTAPGGIDVEDAHMILAGENHGQFTGYVNNGLVTLEVRESGPAGRTLGRRTLNIQNNNVWVEFVVAPEFSLLDDGVAAIVPDLYDAGSGNNALATAVPLGTVRPEEPLDNRSEILSLHNGTDVDWFAFDVAQRAAAAQVYLGFDHSVSDIDVQLLKNINGTFEVIQSGESEDSDESITMQLDPGSYALRIYSYNQQPGFYSLTMNVASVPVPDDAYEPNDAISQPFDLTSYAGVWLRDVAGRGLQGDDDFYRFATPTGVYNLQVYGENRGNLYDLKWSTEPAGRNREYLQAELQLTHFDGNMGLRLFDDFGNLLAQSDTLLDTESIDGFLIARDDFENGDDFASAAILGSADQSHSYLTLHTATDQDFFRWTAPADGNLSLTMDYEHVLGDIDLAVFDAASLDALVAQSSTATDREAVTISVVAGHDYYLRVRSPVGVPHPSYSLLIDGPATETRADFDGDGRVSGFDWLAWQRGFGLLGSATHADGDADYDLDVDTDDLALWRLQWGASTPSNPTPSNPTATAAATAADEVAGQGTAGSLVPRDAALAGLTYGRLAEPGPEHRTSRMVAHPPAMLPASLPAMPPVAVTGSSPSPNRPAYRPGVPTARGVRSEVREEVGLAPSQSLRADTQAVL
jgi:hypothetical protein